MSERNAPIVQTAGLTKVFKDFWRRDRVAAVNDLNLEVRRGEVFGLLGPNGSGKSTTIKMLLGLLYPTRGRISVFGRPPTDVAVKEHIGFLPEESFLYRFLDARETLDLYGRIFKQHTRVRRERIEKLLDMVGLRSEAGRRIGEYSKGMARRIGLAQALINDPEFLILDEPTAGLDPIGIRQIKDVIRQLADKGKTILLSSHLLADVEDVCDRITILYGGRVRADGPVNELLSREDRTQIISEKLTEDTIKKIRHLIEDGEHKAILKVGAPSDRLEAFFMHTVEQAEAANVRSSGAKGSGALPDFLGTRKPANVVESLVAAADVKPTHSKTIEPVALRQPKREEQRAAQLIEQLVCKEPTGPVAKSVSPESATPTPASQKSAAPEPAAPEPATPEPKKVLPDEPSAGDRSVIDNLIGRTEKRDDD